MTLPDVSSNGVFRNPGDGTFADIGTSSLAADHRGAMGLAVGDHGHDGDLDILWFAWSSASRRGTRDRSAHASRSGPTAERWPDGEEEVHEGLPVDRVLRFTRRGPSELTRPDDETIEGAVPELRSVSAP